MALASEHLQRARAEARALLADARVEVERMLAEAQADFWARADAFLGDWEAERQAQRDALVEQAQGLLSQTLKTLLDEFPGNNVPWRWYVSLTRASPGRCVPPCVVQWTCMNPSRPAAAPTPSALATGA